MQVGFPPSYQVRTAGVGRLLRKAALLLLPYVGVLISYFAFDPFKVLRHYERFDAPMAVVPNRDYISTQMYLNTYQQRPYSSFILGNSRTMGFLTRDWMPYIGDTLAFHYDASGESLYGIWQKLQFLEAHHSSLRHVLIVCDTELLKATEDFTHHVYRKDPRTTNSSSLMFQLAFLRAYFSDTFFVKFLKQRFTGRFTPDMEGVLELRRVYYDPITNDMELPEINASIRNDSTGFYRDNNSLHMVRHPAVSDAVIGPAQLQQLVAIRNIFKRHGTDYQIVISPMFHQQQLNPADLGNLQRVFSPARIHDFTGVNEFTQEPGFYYERNHFRPLVGRMILQRIYGPKR